LQKGIERAAEGSRDEIFGACLEYAFASGESAGPLAESLDYSKPLRIAVQKGNLRLVQTLLAHWKPDESQKKTILKREINEAGGGGNYDVVEALLALDQGRSPEEHNMYIVQAIYGAIVQNRIPFVKRLMADASNLEASAARYWVGYPYAASYHQQHHLQHLLHTAAYYGRPEICSMLLDRGVDVNRKAHRGATPLHYAASKGDPKTVQLLLDRGADIEATDDKGYTPLNVAAEEKMEDNVFLLLKNGADVEGGGKTVRPLCNATNQGCDRIFNILIGHGAVDSGTARQRLDEVRRVENVAPFGVSAEYSCVRNCGSYH
jgi:hypothetical protein